MNNETDDEKKAKKETVGLDRGTWGSKWEFFFSSLGFSVGLGNIWRFPYLAYNNGGGAFLIPYFTMLFLVGKPMYFMELALGQFGGTSSIAIWNCAPIAKGLGMSMVLVCWIVLIFYNVIMSYTLYFAFASCQKELPWTKCEPEWTNCYVRSAGINATHVKESRNLTEDLKLSSQLFWERTALDITDGLENLGGIKWDLALCFFLSWIMVTFSLIKGIRSSGKVAYVAATLPFVVLLILLIVGLTKEGAMDGVYYFLRPDWSKVLSVRVWQEAASQMFFSLSVALGGLIVYSSYNDFRHDVFRDAAVISVIDTLTSLVSGLVIFSVLGHMAKGLGVGVDEVVDKGPGLAFVAFPEALSHLPWSNLWSFLFFIMLFSLGLPCFALLENIVSSLCDHFPKLQKFRLRLTLGIATISFLIGLVCVTRGGQYIVEIIDTHGLSLPLVFIAPIECIALCWIYGFRNFAFDVHFMLKRNLGLFWHITWKYISPAILSTIFIYSLVQHSSLKYGNYEYPQFANVIGWCMTSLVIVQVPAWGLYVIFHKNKGLSVKKKLKHALVFNEDWGPKDHKIRKEWTQEKTLAFSVKSESEPKSVSVTQL